MTPLMQLAQRWNLPMQFVNELLVVLGAGAPDETPAAGQYRSEAAVQQQVQLRAAARGARLWRNNVGACEDKTGRMVRYGLANQTAQINKVFKSSDLIGITPLQVTPMMVGRTVGVFTAAECKAPGWTYTGDRSCSCKPGKPQCDNCRQVAQLNFINFVVSRGGIARFVTNPEDF